MNTSPKPRKRARNPAKEREYRRRWRDNNPDKQRAAERQWTTDNRDKKREAGLRWREANRLGERLRVRQHNEDNIDQSRARRAKRRARKANAPQGSPIEAAAYEQILRSAPCELCGSKVPIHIDHIEPLSKGGEHGWENFAGLCQSCNSRKHDKPLLMHMLDQVD